MGSFMGFDREAEVYRALEPLGIAIPHVWGVDEPQDLFLVDRAAGQAWFQAPRDPDVALAVAQDFMRHIATWHRAGARTLDLPSFGPVRSVREHQHDQLEKIKASFEAEDSREPVDLLARVQLDHLLNRVPDFDGEPVLVQGDTGPELHVRRRPRHRDRRLGARAHRRSDGRHRLALVAGDPARLARLPGSTPRVRGRERSPGPRPRQVLPPERARLGPGFGLADIGQAERRRREAMMAGRVEPPRPHRRRQLLP